MEKQWIKRTGADVDLIKALANELVVPHSIGSLLLSRGISSFEEARKFFRPSLDLLHDPFLMKDMDKAVDRLTTAIHKEEKILVYGDYDVDGTTAVTMIYSFLRKIGVKCDYYIPDRYSEGYGFSYRGVDFAKENGFSLIITLDCGIKDGEKVKYASTLGIDVIICDHHNPGELPPACAVLDPKRSDCEYPFEGLSGCGVGFKFLQAFCLQQGIPFSELTSYLDLLTISIGADIVPVSDENRILAFHGLLQLAHTKRPGIAAMLEQAGFKKSELTITDVVFILAPRINAAGRIFSGKQAVEMLLSQDPEEANRLSPALEQNNKTRKGLDKEITREALAQVSADDFYTTSFTTVVASNEWHKGVVGIVASRMVEAYYKPAIVLVKGEELMSGSARSIDGIDLFDALAECADLLEQYGGHAMAAGLSLRSEHFEAFRKRFDEVVSRMLNHNRPSPYILYDVELGFEEINGKFHRVLKQFAPYGPLNMKPVFLATNVCNVKFTRTVGETNAHLKLHVAQKKNLDVVMDGIAFDMGHWAEVLSGGEEVDMLFTIEENEWNGKVSVQINVKDIRISVSPQAKNSQPDAAKASL